MLNLRLGRKEDDLRVVLCLGAHADDIEIGCGATMLQLAEAFPRLLVHWIVFSASPVRRQEAVLSAEAFLAAAGRKQVCIHEFRDGFFPYEGADIKERFEQIKREVSPDLIFTHYRDDLHQDHRTIADLTWNTFRNHLILEYEIPKFDGDLGSPNHFTVVDEAACAKKIDILLSCFASQRQKQWFSRDLFMAILRLRGIEVNSSTGYAEAFYCRKGVWSI